MNDITEITSKVEDKNMGWSVEYVVAAKRCYATITVSGRVMACAWGKNPYEAISNAWGQMNKHLGG